MSNMLKFNNETRTRNHGEKAELSVAYDTLYPGHGNILTNGRETIATYIKHRMEREAQIVEVLRLPVPAELLQSSDSDLDSDGQQQM